MDIKENWKVIRNHFNKSFSSNFHISIASVDSENNPTVTPIGSLFLNDNQTGFYFEKFPSKLPKHARKNPNVCLLGVNSGRMFWIKALFKNKFSDYPAIKLYGKLGEKREATEKEIKRLNRRMKVTKGLKGNATLWGDMQFVREIKLTRAEKVNLGKMTDKLK
ncbi:pyridoxamine 5'-phosphate oxidase family protein [Flagellimonas sp.]|uniref:pyridoxamine 5'-phosphate oxidase family protein n=1 Tax=Flagellimonas sp. TaxID=2058762 RepID=UPI003BAE2035